MSESKSLPTAADVLREAYELIRPGVSGLGIDRAAVLLGIARELREGARRVPPVVLGDNVPDEVVNVISAAHAERDEWRRQAEAAQKEIAELLRQGNGWMQRALKAELADQGFVVMRAEDGYGRTYGGEPAYGTAFNAAVEQLAEDAQVPTPVSAPLFNATREQWTPDGPFVGGPVAEAAARAYANEVKVAVPQPERPADIRFGDAPTGVLPVLHDGTCSTCGTTTYEAVTGEGKETRHRSTGTSACP